MSKDDVLALLAELEQVERERDEWKLESERGKWPKEAAQEFIQMKARLAKVPALVETLKQVRIGSLHDIRRAAFAPEIGARYTEAIRLDIADQCRRLEDSIDASIAVWEQE